MQHYLIEVLDNSGQSYITFEECARIGVNETNVIFYGVDGSMTAVYNSFYRIVPASEEDYLRYQENNQPEEVDPDEVYRQQVEGGF